MIEVKQQKDGISVVGHAGYAEPGKDIVCSGISTLTQTLIQAVEELTTDKIRYRIYDGKVYIRFWTVSDATRVLIEAFFVGCKSIAEAYPAYVKVITK